MEKEVELSIQVELKKLQQRNKDIDDRVAKFKCVHEDIVYIHRYDNVKTLTFLALAEGSNANRLRTSWYGRVIRISNVNCGDEIREGKKALLKKDDVISFNPDAAYALNVTGFEEIWIVHIDSVLHIDDGFEYMKYMEQNAKNKAEVEMRLRINAERQRQAISTQPKITTISDVLRRK